MFHEVMRGSKSFMHVEAFDTMVWRGRTASFLRLPVGISIHYSTWVNQTSPKSWVCCCNIVEIIDCLP